MKDTKLPGPRTVLPLLISGSDGKPKMFEIPEHIKRNTTIGHTNMIVRDNRLIYLGEPGIVEFSICSIYFTLILAMSNLMLECGGL